MLVWLCLGQGADLHMTQLMLLPLAISCSSKSRLVLRSWFYLSVAGPPGLSWTNSKMAVKRLCVCVRACVHACIKMYLIIVPPFFAFSALTLLVGQQEGHPVCENWVVRYWHGYLYGVSCKWFAYYPDDATPSSLLSEKSRMVCLSGTSIEIFHLHSVHCMWICGIEKLYLFYGQQQCSTKSRSQHEDAKFACCGSYESADGLTVWPCMKLLMNYCRLAVLWMSRG